MYKLVGFPKTRAFRVIWMFEELGVPYEVELALPQSEEAKAHNPSGKVPALIVDGETIIDSAAICQFLADRHKQLTYEAGTIERAKQDSWTQFASDDVELPLWVNAKHSFVLPEELRVEAVKDACKFDFDRAMRTMEARLGNGPYVMGEKFTVPDILLGHCANWAAMGPGWEIPNGAVADYMDRVRAREGYLRAISARDKLCGD